MNGQSAPSRGRAAIDASVPYVRLAGVLGWLAAGTFDASYGHYFQNTSFGNAHVLQLGYTMPY